MIRNQLDKFSKLGINESMTISQKKSITLLNYLILGIFVLFTILTLFNFVLNDTPYIAYLLDAVIALSCFLLNKYNKTNWTKFIVSFLYPFSFLFASVHASLTYPNYDIILYITPLLFIIMGVVLPVLFFGVRERRQLIIALIPTVLIYVFYNQIHSFWGFDFTTIFSNNHSFLVFRLVGFILMIFGSFSLILIQNLNSKYEKEIKKTNQNLLLSKFELKERHNELQAIEEELRQNNEELFTINEHLENKSKLIEEQKKKFELLFENSNDAILLMKDGKFYDCNSATARMLKYPSKDAILNLKPSDISPKEINGKLSSDIATEMITIALEKGVHKFEWIHKKSDDTLFPCEIWLTPMKIDDEVIVHSVIRDLSQQKADQKIIQEQIEELQSIEEELRQNNEELYTINENIEKKSLIIEEEKKKFELLFENSNDAILLMKDGKFYDCNSATAQLLKYPNKDAILNLKPSDISPKEINGRLSSDIATEMITIALENGLHKFEWIHKKSDGSLFPCEVWLTPMKIDNEVIVHSVIRDLSLQKEADNIIKKQIEELTAAEEELRQNNEELQTLNENTSQQNKLITKQKTLLELEKQKALEASKYKSLFLANMSHEIRTPLNGIIGMADILKESNLNSEQKKQLEIIDISGNSLLSIVNDILDYSKIEANQLELENIPINLFDEVGSVVKMLNLKAQSKGLELSHSIHPDTPQFIEGDALRIKQILINFCNNSLKFTEKGFVNINIEPVSKTKDKVVLRFNVKDTGIGISKENQNKLFKEFSQVDASTTRKFGGTGLGLSISKKLAHLMDGEVGIYSELGKGSTFWFTGEYTIKERVEIEFPSKNKKITISQELRILLVEDNLINQKVAAHTIKKNGHQLDIANDGLEAVEKFQNNTYDLILMDIQMPNMNGYEATQMIRKIEQEKGSDAIKIIAMTANALKGEKEKCLSIGMSGYLAKPFKQDDLIAILSQV